MGTAVTYDAWPLIKQKAHSLMTVKVDPEAPANVKENCIKYKIYVRVLCKDTDLLRSTNNRNWKIIIWDSIFIFIDMIFVFRVVLSKLLVRLLQTYLPFKNLVFPSWLQDIFFLRKVLLNQKME